MPYRLKLDAFWSSQGWQVKIRDQERNEDPHVSFLRRTRTWRWNLRTLAFMDKEPPTSDVPEELLAAVRAQHTLLCAEWDRMYPVNPVGVETKHA